MMQRQNLTWCSEVETRFNSEDLVKKEETLEVYILRRVYE